MLGKCRRRNETTFSVQYSDKLSAIFSKPLIPSDEIGWQMRFLFFVLPILLFIYIFFFLNETTVVLNFDSMSQKII